jgi:ABC-2 type transport system ATP-binding protein
MSCGMSAVTRADDLGLFPQTGGFAIVVDGLRKSYGNLVAVDGISFDVKDREIFGLLGPNGAGKTTTVEILEGLRQADAGRAIVAGINVLKEPQKVKGLIGVQLQASAFFDFLSLAELIEMFASLYCRQVDARALLRRVGLEEKANSRVKTLSGGQKQRFSISTALVNEPRVLFLDEPTTGLDPQARRNLWELAQSLRADGRTIVLTTHYMDEAETLCDRVAVMDHGKIIALDAPAALVQNLLAKGFRRRTAEREANLEDVFLDLTGHQLREA